MAETDIDKCCFNVEHPEVQPEDCSDCGVGIRPDRGSWVSQALT